MIQTAQALRLVRHAQVDFLLNWTRAQAEDIRMPDRLANLVPIDDSDKRNWRHLYDGSVLDD